MRLLFAALLAVCLLPLTARADQRWLVVSDLHVDPSDRSPQPSTYEYDTNWPLFASTVAAMHRAEPNPPVVIITGDFLAHHFAAAARASAPHQTTAAVARTTMKRIEQTFARAFPKSQFVIVLGNNDDPCGDYATGPNSAYLSDVARIWAPLVNRNGAAPQFVKQFSHAGYYTARLPVKHLRALALDSVYWSIVYRSCGRGGGNPPADQLSWFARTLGSTPAGTRNLIVMHVPPGIDAVSTLMAHRFLVVPFLRDGVQKQFIADTARNANRIAFMLAGHQHLNEFRVVGDVPVLVAPSVSPVYKNNPAFLRLEIGGDGTLKNYQLFDYDPYGGSWNKGFDFDAVYGVGAFDARSLELVHAKIAQDPQLRDRWANALVSGAPYRKIDTGNWKAYWCAQTAVGSAYAACAGDQRRVAVVPVVLLIVGALAAVALAALAVLAVRLASQRAKA